MASSRACPAAACPCHNANCNDADDDNDEDVTRPYEDRDCHVLHMTTHIGLHTYGMLQTFQHDRPYRLLIEYFICYDMCEHQRT